jgi:hypothetical protein
MSRKTQRRGVYIGICTIALVVVITTILECAIAISPVVFLRLSETSTSEEDAILTAQITLVRGIVYVLMQTDFWPLPQPFDLVLVV